MCSAAYSYCWVSGLTFVSSLALRLQEARIIVSLGLLTIATFLLLHIVVPIYLCDVCPAILFWYSLFVCRHLHFRSTRCQYPQSFCVIEQYRQTLSAPWVWYISIWDTFFYFFSEYSRNWRFRGLCLLSRFSSVFSMMFDRSGVLLSSDLRPIPAQPANVCLLRSHARSDSAACKLILIWPLD